MSSTKISLLSLLNIHPSAQSIDFVNKKTQFQLHNLITEQRHTKTWSLSSSIKKNIKEGLKQILSVDEDISRRFHNMAQDFSELDHAASAVSRAIEERRKIYIYGCGATGRLAKQMESALWRPFWNRIKQSLLWEKLKPHLPEDIEQRLIGEMTGGDRALISALEGFEDLNLMGELQLVDRKISKGDVVIGITEGGETSSVIGAVCAALDQYGKPAQKTVNDARNQLYFIYNNPDDVLEPFVRSRSVIKNPSITKINLTTGPQAIAGSTRMQAATSETFIMAVILEEGVRRALKNYLTKEELIHLGFGQDSGIKKRLLSFDSLREVLMTELKNMGRFATLEAETYKNNRRATYFAQKALITVFIDCAERSPTFHLYPLDTIHEKKGKCWFQVWTEGKNYKEAWQSFLGRSFQSLEQGFYKPPITSQVDDVYLKHAALKSLSKAGKEQERQYDFSFSEKNISTRGPQRGDLGVVVCVDEEIGELANPDSSFSRFVHLFKDKGASLALLLIGGRQEQNFEKITNRLPIDPEKDIVLPIFIERKNDPLNINQQIILKILLNAHSTGAMAKMEKMVGNTMTYVNPSNLKLIGRATYLIMSHVNDVLIQDEWIKKHGELKPIEYAQINAVLFDAIDFLSDRIEQISEVALSIIRILESLINKKNVTWEEALSIATTTGLENYLEKLNPSLRY